MKPLDVKTKFYNAESDEVFLEAQVNISFNCVLYIVVALIASGSIHIFDESLIGFCIVFAIYDTELLFKLKLF